MAKEGIPFILVPLLLAGVLTLFGWWWIALVLLAIAAFMAFFFRDPTRTAPEDSGVVVSAADGRVTRITETDEAKVISVFLSPLDVHINRSPIAGTVTKIAYQKGKKLPATNNDASFLNERNALSIDGDGISVVCTQIAGILARRIVCWCKAGDILERGQRFGLIKFSSRTDVSMPPNVRLAVKIGDRVRGGETVIARFDR